MWNYIKQLKITQFLEMGILFLIKNKAPDNIYPRLNPIAEFERV